MFRNILGRWPGEGSNNSYVLWMERGDVHFWASCDGTFPDHEPDTTEHFIPEDEWSHLAVTFEDEVATLFVDGTVVGTVPDHSPREISGTVVPTRFGAYAVLDDRCRP